MLGRSGLASVKPKTHWLMVFVLVMLFISVAGARVVIGGRNATGSMLFTIDDDFNVMQPGQLFAELDPPSNSRYFKSIAYSPELSVWLACGDNGNIPADKNQSLRWSSDGLNWGLVSTTLAACQSVEWGLDQGTTGHFVAVGPSGAVVSTDGTFFSEIVSLNGTGLSAVVYSSFWNRWVVGDSFGQVRHLNGPVGPTSTFSTPVSVSASLKIERLTASPSRGALVATTGLSNGVFTSSDGNSWNSLPFPSFSPLGLAWSKGMFLVGDASSPVLFLVPDSLDVPFNQIVRFNVANLTRIFTFARMRCLGLSCCQKVQAPIE